MKTFTEQIIEARKVSTPFVVLRTFDPFATCKAAAKARSSTRGEVAASNSKN